MRDFIQLQLLVKTQCQDLSVMGREVAEHIGQPVLLVTSCGLLERVWTRTWEPIEQRDSAFTLCGGCRIFKGQRLPAPSLIDHQVPGNGQQP